MLYSLRHFQPKSSQAGLELVILLSRPLRFIKGIMTRQPFVFKSQEKGYISEQF
jgi:hypothetical protein